jgi:hypothetical protein
MKKSIKLRKKACNFYIAPGTAGSAISSNTSLNEQSPFSIQVLSLSEERRPGILFLITFAKATISNLIKFVMRSEMPA